MRHFTMNIAEIAKQQFPDAEYGLPCTPEEIAEAEKILNQKFPIELNTLYLAFNGIRVSGYPYKLFPLLQRHTSSISLISANDLYRHHWPQPVDLSDIIFFGMSKGNDYWGVKVTGDPVVVKYSYDLEKPEIIGHSIAEIYVREEKLL